MAQPQSNKKERPSLFLKLTPVKENRAGAEFPSIGRFKYFSSVHKAYSSQLMLINLFAFIFFLPLIGFVTYVNYIGVEQFAYLLAGISDIPYFMGGIGVGLGSGTDAVVGEIHILYARLIEYVVIGAGLTFTGIGLSGLFHVANVMLWREPFSKYKLNKKTGVYEPKVFMEYLIGIKKYWLPTTIVTFILGALFSGTFASVFWLAISVAQGTANAGQYILAIFACIVLLIAFMYSFVFLPMISQYDCKMSVKLKNSVIFTIKQVLQLIFIAGILALISYLATRGGLWMIIFVIFIAGFMLELLVLMLDNLSQYNAQVIVKPLYDRMENVKKRTERKKRK